MKLWNPAQTRAYKNKWSQTSVSLFVSLNAPPVFVFPRTCFTMIHYENVQKLFLCSINTLYIPQTFPKPLSQIKVSLVVWWFSRIARFSNVQHLSIHISKNFGAESTRVYYIGLRGEYSEVSLNLNPPYETLTVSMTSLTKASGAKICCFCCLNHICHPSQTPLGDSVAFNNCCASLI